MWSSPSNPASKDRKIGVPTRSVHKLLTIGILAITLGTTVRNVSADASTALSAGAFLFHNEAATPTVVTDGVSSSGSYNDLVTASRATTGQLGLGFSLSNNSLICTLAGTCSPGPPLTNATISANSSTLTPSQFPSLQQPPSSLFPCPAATRDRSTPFPVTWKATTPLPSSSSSACSNIFGVTDLTRQTNVPLVVSTGYNSSRSVIPAVINPGTTSQTTDIAVTLPNTSPWTTQAQIVVNILQAQGPITSGSSSVSTVCGGPAPPSGAATCLQPGSDPSSGNWILSFPQPGATYTFRITATVTNTTSAQVLSLPFVQVVGIAHSTSGGDVFGSGTGASVVINDPLIPTATMTATFSVDQTVQSSTVLQVDKAVLYPSFFGPPPCDQNSQGNQNQTQNSQACKNP